MKPRLSILGALPAVLWVAPLRAQQPTGAVRGGVIDEATRQPIAGVMVTAGDRQALSQADGRYSITLVPPGTYTVRARMLGYAPVTQSVTVVGGQETVVDFAMTGRAVSLSEIVVTGYGEQRVGDISGAVSEVTPKAFNPGTIVDPLQLIQSKVAGVQVVASSNEPGAYTSVLIRGQTSVNASSEPLYVIDGVPLGGGADRGLSARRDPLEGRDPLNFLNPQDIESITVLRDASAAAIFGANAANGVVVIQTKSGRRGTQITYSSTMSASSAARHLQVLNAAQFDSLVRLYAPQSVSQLGTASTDWFDLVSRTAFGQEHNLTISSAGQASSYRLSVGYLSQDGIVRATTTDRLSLGMGYEQRLFNDRLNVRANLKGARAFDRFTPDAVIGSAAAMGPTQPVMDSSSATGYYEWPGITLSPDNPLAILALVSDHGTTWRSLGNAQAEYRLPFFPTLKATVNVGYDVTKSDRETFYPSRLRGELRGGAGGEDFRWEGTEANTLFEAYLNYAAPLNVVPGTIDLTGGYSYAQSHRKYTSLYLSGLSTDLLGDNGFPAAQTVTPGMTVDESKLIALFGRLNYNLDDRYLASFSVRRDGSSRFGPAHAWGVFPSVSLAWRISGEPFLSGFTPLSDLKLRASWGRTGNQAFENYQQYSAYTVSNAVAQYQFGNQPVATIRPSAVDPNIKWEETDSYNVGLDFGFLNQRVAGAIDRYVKKTRDLIFTVPVAAGTNLSNYLTTNIGSMRNQGVELSLSARILRGGRHALGWTADVTAAHNTNTLVSINPYGGPVQQIMVGSIGLAGTIQVLEPGQPINSFFVCRQYYQDRKPVEGGYLSLVGDSVIQGCVNSERRAYHDPAPKWILGHTSYLTYGNFDLSFSLRAWLGNYVYNGVAAGTGLTGLSGPSPANLSTSILETGFMYGQFLSDHFVEDASFLRMDNVTVGYTFQYRGQPMRVFATVQNAFTITGYSGVDPSGQGVSGIDNTIYPLSRTLTGGLSVRF
jgi:TonB-linked SusC/RagA family outer membrane protein